MSTPLDPLPPAERAVHARVYSLCETVAGFFHLWAFAPFIPGDSREVVRLAIEWADSFEKANEGRAWDGDYLEEVEAGFATRYRDWLRSAGPDLYVNQNRGGWKGHDSQTVTRTQVRDWLDQHPSTPTHR